MRSILDDGAALFLWLSAIPVGVFAMYAVDDFRMFLIAWARGRAFRRCPRRRSSAPRRATVRPGRYFPSADRAGPASTR